MDTIGVQLSIVQQESLIDTSKPVEFTCRVCSQNFHTRNSLFRHLRADPHCSRQTNNQKFVKQSFVLSFAHSTTTSDNEVAGKLVQNKVLDYFRLIIDNTTEIVSSTQASVARHRPKTLQVDCPAAADVLALTLNVPEASCKQISLSNLLSFINDYHHEDLCNNHTRTFAVKHIDKPLHAERSCTQYVYHYLLPLSWLPDADVLVRWSHTNTSIGPSTDSLRLLKRNLREFECPQTQDYLGRFGALGLRTRRCWHNYADPNLRGQISPNHEPVWRIVDRARIADILPGYAVVQVQADNVLPQQIERMIATAVARTHEWLPKSYFNESLQQDLVLETPAAPSHLLYLANVRYHFDELTTNGQSLFSTNTSGMVYAMMTDPTRWIQSKILSLHCVCDELEWLRRLETEVAPRIVQNWQKRRQKQSPALHNTFAPLEYTLVLEKLHNIIVTSQWPVTSSSRSNVIKGAISESSGGSFTVINPKTSPNVPTPLGNDLFPDLVESIFALEEMLSRVPRLRVNGDGTIEQQKTLRKASTHCAVNANAQFTPHVDSGRGAGQTISMIVGLGNYSGGELNVEGDSFDIRYQPLEFDGYKLRHWTNVFQGERFSLVWFTPDLKEK